MSKQEYASLERLVREWPDFFEKEFKRIRKSEGVLGKLYRDIQNESAMDAFLRNDYKHSIMLDYQLDPRILSLPLNVNEMHKLLQIAFQKLVAPMTLRIKQLMTEFCFATESELFSSDLRYKFCDDSLRNVYHNDYP